VREPLLQFVQNRDEKYQPQQTKNSGARTHQPAVSYQPRAKEDIGKAILNRMPIGSPVKI